MIRFLGDKKKIWLGVSLGLLVLGVTALIIYKLPFGIDFKGGALLEFKTAQNYSVEQVREKTKNINLIKSGTITETGESYLLKLPPITEPDHQAILKELDTSLGKTTELQFQSVGPSVSKDLTRKAVQAIVIAAVAIILYLAYAFRGVTKPISSWRFGAIAVIALLHDLMITIGVFALLAHFFGFEVDASIITALLTVMGFSVHDTIVVFDRTRENVIRNHPNTALEFEQIADKSLGETLNRSITTSVTVLITLTSLLIIGGESIKPFVLVLLVGIAVGTYSSIFTATPLLVLWQNRIFSKLTK
ncbi:protein translocase subunit SecF [Candidatus Berkelbacteria bacterium]|nr:protein translocase subunit SecF [Candidatus Berkelbacteria bacterium]